MRHFLKKRVVSFALVLAIGFLLLVSLAISAAIRGFQDFLEQHLHVPTGWLDFANSILSFAVFAVLFGTIYRFLPDAKIRWQTVAVGALSTAFLFSVGKWAIGLYIGRTALASTYGAAGSIVLILLWVYYTSMIVLLGAEFTRAWARWMEGRVGAPEPGAERRPRPRALPDRDSG